MMKDKNPCYQLSGLKMQIKMRQSENKEKS